MVRWYTVWTRYRDEPSWEFVERTQNRAQAYEMARALRELHSNTRGPCLAKVESEEVRE